MQNGSIGSIAGKHMRFLELNDALSKGVEKIYLIEGEDLFLRNRSLERIKESKVFSYLELNCSVVRAEEGLDAIFGACLAMPFLSEKRLVVVYDLIVTSDIAKRLRDFAEQSGDNYCLVIINEPKTQVKKLDGICRVTCDRLDAVNVAKWIDVAARRNRLKISAENAKKLAMLCNCDMSVVKNETDKLVNYSVGVITEEDIDECVAAEPEFTAFYLTDCIAKKDTDGALKVLQRMTSGTDDYFGVTALIYGSFKRMFFAKNSTGSEEEIAASLGVKPAAIRFAREKAESFGAKRLLRAMELCLEADEQLKTRTINKPDRLELLVLRLINL